MSNTIIQIENLAKKYLIKHQQQGSYTALRDVITEKVKSLGKRIISPWNNRQSSTHSTTEDFWALKDISFKVKQGEVIGIIGRNGAGKSTLLKIISRITEPTKGRIRIKGRVASLLEVGTGFHPELTGRENIFLNGAILGMGKAEIKRKFDEIVDFAEIEKFLDTPVKRYSSGMYVRLAFAVAAHLEPEILLVDEVLAVGDAAFQKKCWGKMKKVGEEGRTVLFVSHNLGAIKALCSRAILLKEGGVVADSSADETVSTYMGDVRESVLVREWHDEHTAPQNQSAVLRRVRVCDDHGRQLDEIYTDTPFNIEIDYRMMGDRASVGLNVLFYDNANNCIMASISNHEGNWYGKPMPAGDYSSVCKVPKNLFNNGYFNLSVMVFGKSFTDFIKEDGILNIEILDGTEVRGDYHGHYACSIRPMLGWTTRRISG
jgi:lipopolysaccharide transport system ATP-binding protein